MPDNFVPASCRNCESGPIIRPSRPWEPGCSFLHCYGRWRAACSRSTRGETPGATIVADRQPGSDPRLPSQLTCGHPGPWTAPHALAGGQQAALRSGELVVEQPWRTGALGAGLSEATQRRGLFLGLHALAVTAMPSAPARATMPVTSRTHRSGDALDRDQQQPVTWIDAPLRWAIFAGEPRQQPPRRRRGRRTR